MGLAGRRRPARPDRLDHPSGAHRNKERGQQCDADPGSRPDSASIDPRRVIGPSSGRLHWRNPTITQG
eukprot:1889094-Heterocapsa_arctica.AAC.1